MKFNSHVKEHTQNQSQINKKNISEINGNCYKNKPKKEKKGVDSLLEKLESSSKNLSYSDNQDVPFANSKIIERMSCRVKSVSPDYSKSKSPSREDDVISPSLSNDDSNDTKQRRKRKLEIPIRLSKEFKLNANNLSLKNSESQINLNSDPDKYSYNKLYTPIRKKDLTNEIIEKTEKYNTEIYLNKSIVNKIDLQNMHELSTNKNDINTKFAKQSKECNQCENLSVLDMSKYLLDSLKSTERSRPRRNSECVIDVCSRNKKMRRKSYDNFRELSSELVLKPYTSNHTPAFQEVESQLEKMFAGIVEIDKSVSKKSLIRTEKIVKAYSEENANTSFQQELTHNTVILNDKSEPQDLLKMCSIESLTGLKNKISNQCINVKRRNKKQRVYQKSMRKKVLKKKKNIISNELLHETNIHNSVVKYKGPIIQIRGFKKMSSYIQIVNAPKEDDEERIKEKRKVSCNGNVSRSIKSNFQNNLDYRGKSLNTGLFNSTLSTRYDSHTADITWICVFCKRGPHYLVTDHLTYSSTNLCNVQDISKHYKMTPTILSDLFGPYLIEKFWIEDNISIDNSHIVVQTREENKNVLRLEHSVCEDQSTKPKKQESKSINKFYMEINTLGVDDQPWEVWLHEQCIIWTTGVFITGGRICGLQEAIWDAAQSICDTCGLTGANISCIKRGCKSITHYCCAIISGWQLDTNHFLPECNTHNN